MMKTKFNDYYQIIPFPYVGCGLTFIEEPSFRISGKLYRAEPLLHDSKFDLVVDGGPTMDFSIGLMGVPVLTERAYAAVSDLISTCTLSYPVRLAPTGEQMYVLTVPRTVPQSLVPSLARLVYGEQPDDPTIEDTLDRDLLPLGPLLRLVGESGTDLICHRTLVDRILSAGLVGPGLRELGTDRSVQPGFLKRLGSSPEESSH